MTKTRVRNWLPAFLLVLPSIVLIGVFVYYFIGKNIATSLTDEHTLNKNKPVTGVGFDNYQTLFADDRYHHALLNLLVLAVVFIVGTMFFGLVWALLLEKGVTAEGFFRSSFLFPMAVSFIAAGVVWKWLLSPAQGSQAYGLNKLFQLMGLDGLQNKWWSGSGELNLFGLHIPLNMAGMAIPAIWQLAGYVMALFLAGFRGIDAEQREAARMDGASEFKIYRHIIFPQLSPVALSALIIVGHMSMKMFDLIYSIAGQNSYQAEVPATLMWTQLYQKSDPAMATTNATVLLVIVAVVVIPYLIYTNKVEKRAA